MQNKDKDDGIEDSPLDMILVILLEEASKEVVVVTPSSTRSLSFGVLYGTMFIGPVVGSSSSFDPSISNLGKAHLV